MHPRTEHLWLLSLKICAGIKLDPEPGSSPKPAPLLSALHTLCPSESCGWWQKIMKIKCKYHQIKFTTPKRPDTALHVPSNLCPNRINFVLLLNGACNEAVDTPLGLGLGLITVPGGKGREERLLQECCSESHSSSPTVRDLEIIKLLGVFLWLFLAPGSIRLWKRSLH